MSENKTQKTISERLKDYNNSLREYLRKDIAKEYIENNKLSYKLMMGFKSHLHDVNNILTLLTTMQFVKLLDIDESNVDNNPNANGYDFVYDDNNNVIVAEVKCNIPWGTNIYGSRQKEEIIKDLDGLIKEKKKSQLKANASKFYKAIKFLVVLADDQKNASTAMTNLIEEVDKCQITTPTKYLPEAKNKIKKTLNDLHIKGLKNIVEEYDIKSSSNTIRTINDLDNNKVYVVYIEPDDDLISELMDEKNNGCNISAQL